LIPFSFEFLGQMTPKLKIFKKYFPIRFERTWIDVLWQNLVKIGNWKVAEKSSRIGNKIPVALNALGLTEAPFCSHCTAPVALQISRTSSPLDLRMRTKFSLDRLGFAEIIRDTECCSTWR